MHIRMFSVHCCFADVETTVIVALEMIYQTSRQWQTVKIRIIILKNVDSCRRIINYNISAE